MQGIESLRGGRHVRFVGGRKAGTGAASEAMWEEKKKNWREKEREKKVQLPRQIENLFLLDLLRTGHVVQECNHLLRKDEGRQQTSPSCINVTDGWSDRGCLCLHVFMLARMEVLNHWQGGSMKIYTIWQGQVGKKKKKTPLCVLPTDSVITGISKGVD